MSAGAACPACGVAVVPGYVRCPKCHKPLPRPTRRAGTSPAEGGTAVASKNSLSVIALIAVAVLGAGLVIYLGMRSGKHDEPAVVPPEPTSEEGAAEGQTPGQPAEAPTRPDQPAAPTGDAIAADLERALKKQRLWSTVSVVGNHVDVRSGACSDPAMTSTVASFAGGLKAAGLTRLRCLEESGHVVSERDL
jgi:hypothetical protein